MSDDLAADNTKHADLLNALCEMQASHQYAARKTVLARAETLILAQEQQIEALQAQLAGYRKVGCISKSDLGIWEAGIPDVLSAHRHPQAFMTEWKTIYVKDNP